MSERPSQMRVIEIVAPGGPEALALSQRELPAVGDADVLIKVAAAGVNRADLLQRRGHYPPPPGAPAHPGLEVAGMIVEVGRAVREFKAGDRVCALLQGGGYAEYCAVNAGQALRIPGALDMIHAASLPEAYFTVWSNVFEIGGLQTGESLLVHGGASGVGVAAIQLAVARGHTVFATAGSEDKLRFCESLGAKRAIDYKNEDFVGALAEQTGGRGVDVILDIVGGDYLARNLQALADDGRLVMIAAQGGVRGELDVLRVMQRRLTVTGSTLRGRSVEFKRHIRARLQQHVWPLFVEKRIRAVVDKVFPLAQAAAAHAYMEAGAHKGKIVLTVP